MEIGGEQVVIRGNSRVSTAEEIGQVPLKFGGAVKPLLVRDVAQVGIGSSFRTGAATVNGEEGVLGNALMLAGGNSSIVARDVAAKGIHPTPRWSNCSGKHSGMLALATFATAYAGGEGWTSDFEAAKKLHAQQIMNDVDLRLKEVGRRAGPG